MKAHPTPNPPIRTACSHIRALSTATLLASSSLASAQTFDSGPWGPGPANDTTPSMGLFRIVVDPAFRLLMEPGPGLSGYPGYVSADGRLTSPVMIDNFTTIARSSRHDRLFLGTKPVGVPSLGPVGYADYAAIPPEFALSPPPTEEIFTQIRSLRLRTTPERQCTNTDPRIPSVPVSWDMVLAGPENGLEPVLLKSVGMVQEDVAGGAALGAAAPDFPARSFFDVFVMVSLPGLPMTQSGVAFPPTPPWPMPAAVLYNDSPLIVKNFSVTELPPHVVYIHGDTPVAVPLKFRDNNPPYWSAGDVFGSLTLAGHGTFPPNCASEEALAEAVLGPLGASAPEPPVEWLRVSPLSPPPGASFDSVKSEDIVKFVLAGFGTLYLRDVVHTNLPNPIPPPPRGGSATWSATNTLMTGAISLDQQVWFPVQATGPAEVIIQNTNPPNAALNLFPTRLTQLSLSGNSPLGLFRLRASPSPNRPSLGQHTLRAEPRGFRASSYLDVQLDLSTDNGQTWIPADRALRVYASAPRAAPGKLWISHTQGPTGGMIVLNWFSQFQLQRASQAGGPYTDIVGVMDGPYTEQVGTAAAYYRLRQ